MKNLFQRSVTHLQKMGSGKKSTMVIAVLMLITAPLLAADYSAKSSVITFSTWNNKPFIIEVNQQRYRSNGTITLRDITPGKLRVKMFRNHQSNGPRSGSGVVLYNGFVDIPVRSKVKAELNRNNRMRVTQVRNNGNKPNVNRPYNSNPNGNRPNGNQTLNGYETQGNTIPYEESHGFEPYGQEHNQGYGGAYAMEHHEFNRLLNRINNESFSSDKVRAAKQAVRHNYISVMQLEKLIRAMDYDSDQLAIAKFGYENVLDKERIWKVYDAFSFSSTARKFERFVCQA